MDDTLQELENELKRLTPRRPSVACRTALERALEAADSVAPGSGTGRAVNARWLPWITWSLAAAAMIALGAVFQFTRQAAPPAVGTANVVAGSRPAPVADRANRYEPVQATSVLYDLKEDGTTVLADRTEGRQVRYRYVDTYTWKNPTTNASLRWSVPRDEVRVIRASLD